MVVGTDRAKNFLSVAFSPGRDLRLTTAAGPWDAQKFLASLRSAENTPRKQLKPSGNRAVIYCSTTDPYQVIRHPDSARQREMAAHARFLVRHSLELIRDESTLNVRILTRSPLARADFDLFKSFGKRLFFGMSLATLRNDLAKVYEPKAPAPSQRLATLKAALEAGLHVYVAMAPIYPECDEADLRATLNAVAKLKPVTIFHEPINIRAENVARIEAQAADMGVCVVNNLTKFAFAVFGQPHSDDSSSSAQLANSLKPAILEDGTRFHALHRVCQTIKIAAECLYCNPFIESAGNKNNSGL